MCVCACVCVIESEGKHALFLIRAIAHTHTSHRNWKNYDGQSDCERLQSDFY